MADFHYYSMLSEEEQEQYFNNFFEQAKLIDMSTSINELEVLMRNIRTFCDRNLNYKHNDRLLLLFTYLAECRKSKEAKNDIGFKHLEVYIKAQKQFIQKGWLSK